MNPATLPEPLTGFPILNKPISHQRIILSPRGYFGYVGKVYDITQFEKVGNEYRYADGLLIHKPAGKWQIY